MSKVRLTCPNCGAQYEVPAQVIPAKGRDVQCSNCSHTWFQAHPDAAPTEPPPRPRAQPQPAAPAAPERPVAPPPPPQARPSPPESGPDDSDTVEPAMADAPPPPPRRRLDPEVAEVLRAEAQHEARQRAADRAALETQPDLGLDHPSEDESARRRREARARMAQLRGEESGTQTTMPAPQAPAPSRAPAPLPEPGTAPAPQRPAPRSEVFPDVEEVNQTLRRDPPGTRFDESRSLPMPDHDARGGGFGRGFWTMIVLAALAIGVYAYAPRLSQQLPPAAPYLSAYTDTVNQGRAWLDGQVTALLQQLDSLSSEADQDTAPPPQDG